MHEAPALPYGAVMATGVASALAGSAGLGSLRLPLLWVAAAVWLGGAVRCRLGGGFWVAGSVVLVPVLAGSVWSPTFATVFL